MCYGRVLSTLLFFFTHSPTTRLYTLSLHDALPISTRTCRRSIRLSRPVDSSRAWPRSRQDRKSTRLNSSHANISYAVFCLKKKKHAAMPGDPADGPRPGIVDVAPGG